MSVCFYILTDVTDITMRLDVFCYIMSKVFAINDFVYLFYSEIFFL